MTVAPQLTAQVTHLEGCYLRYFSGRPHPTCDLLYLHEIVERLEAIVQKVTDFPAIHDPLAERLCQLRQEAVEIELALRLEYPPEANVGYLAARSNQQIQLYIRHLAHRPRFTRRPRLVARIAANLTSILAAMRALEQGFKSDDNTRNIGVVERELANAEAEALEIEKERSTSSRSELIRLLGAQTNQELIEARKKRPTMELDDLAGICDRVGELAYQMLQLADETDDTINLANLRLASRAIEELEADHAKLHEKTLFVSVAQVVASAPSLRAQLTCAETTEALRQEALGRLEAFLADPLVRQLVVDARTK